MDLSGLASESLDQGPTIELAGCTTVTNMIMLLVVINLVVMAAIIAEICTARFHACHKCSSAS